MMLDLKKLFPNSKFPTAEELKTKEDTFSIGDHVKVADNIRCIQHGQTGVIARIEPEDKHGWKSFIVKFDDEKYGAMGFQSGNIDKIDERETTMKKINENADDYCGSPYNGYEKEANYVIPYLKHNNIHCRKFGWLGMVGDIDIVKIDGKIRKFNIKTKEEVFDRGLHENQKVTLTFGQLKRLIKEYQVGTYDMTDSVEGDGCGLISKKDVFSENLTRRQKQRIEEFVNSWCEDHVDEVHSPDEPWDDDVDLCIADLRNSGEVDWEPKQDFQVKGCVTYYMSRWSVNHRR